jgi:hypothetical protein
MKRRIVVVTTVLGLMLSSGAAAAAPSEHLTSRGQTVHAATGPTAVVRVRVEGDTGTIFEGTVRTSGHNVTTVAGGTHRCDGTNNGANPSPGPTATGALDTGSLQAGYTFDGPFDATFEDFFISRIGGNTQTSTQFWGILLNGSFTAVGGCQQRVQNNDEVLFAFDAFSKSHVLRLTGPTHVKVRQPATYHVTDVQTGAPIAGADVNGVTSDAAGNATLTFTAPTALRVKANRGDSIRSNAVVTRVRA